MMVSNRITDVCSTAWGYLCHYGVGTNVASIKAAKLLWHLGDVLPEKKCFKTQKKGIKIWAYDWIFERP